MMPPFGTPAGGSNRGDEQRSDASGLLAGAEKGWSDPGHADLPGDTQGALAGGAALLGAAVLGAAVLGATSGAPHEAEPEASPGGTYQELPEDRVAVVPRLNTAEDTSAWDAGDPDMMWPFGGRKEEDEEEEEYLPKYVINDEDGWTDEDEGTAEEAEEQLPKDVISDEDGWIDEDSAAAAAELGILPPRRTDDAPAEPVTGPGLATWRPDRSARDDDDDMPVFNGNFSGMLCADAGAFDEEEDESDDTHGSDGEEEKNSRGIADLLKQGADSWGVGVDHSGILG